MKKIYIFAVVTILLLSGCGQGLSPRTKFHIHEASKTASSMRDNWKAMKPHIKAADESDELVINAYKDTHEDALSDFADSLETLDKTVNGLQEE